MLMLGNFSLHTKGSMRARALPLARALRRRGYEVQVVMASLDAPWASGVVGDGTGLTVRHVAPVAPPGLRQLGALTALVRAALLGQADVVHVFKPIAYSGAVATLLTSLAHLGADTPRLVVDTDDWEGTNGWADLDRRPWWQRRVIDWQEGWNLRHSASLTVASRELFELARDAGAATDQMHYLPNGVESVSGPPASAARLAARRKLGLGIGPQILLYSRFAEFPLSQVVQLLRRVAEERPEASMLVVGRGFHEEENTLAQMFASAGLQGAVHMAGWVEPSELADYFAAADLAIYPFADTLVNRTKCPAKLVELMAAGVPVVAERVGQISQYVEHGESGLLVAPGDEAGFAMAVLRLLAEAEQREALSAGAARRIASHFLWDRLVEQALTAYGWHPAKLAGQAGVAV
ncbi:MAG: glycosyltransferase family 4 protein [Chloroflexota bacterium]